MMRKNPLYVERLVMKFLIGEYGGWKIIGGQRVLGEHIPKLLREHRRERAFEGDLRVAFLNVRFEVVLKNSA